MMYYHIYRTRRKSTVLLREHIRIIRKLTTTACLLRTKDHYKTLEVSRTASEEEVKSSYIKLAKLHHPDANIDGDSCHAKIAEINEAYEHLGDAEKRKRYDDLLRYHEKPSWRRHADGPPQGHHERPHSYDYYKYNRPNRPLWDDHLGRDPDDDSHKTWWQKNRLGVALFISINAAMIHLFVMMSDHLTEKHLEDMVFADMTPEQLKIYYDPERCTRYRRTADMFDPKKVKEMAEREKLISSLRRPPVSEHKMLGYLAENFKPLKVRAAPPRDNDSDLQNKHGIEDIRKKAKADMTAPSIANEQDSKRVTIHVEIPKSENKTFMSS